MGDSERGERAKAADVKAEDATLRRELAEAHERQTATSEILGAISRAPFELQSVLDAIVKTASRLCAAEFAVIFKRDGDYLVIAAANNADATFIKFATESPIVFDRGTCAGRAFVERRPVHIPDCLADAEYTAFGYQKVGRFRSMLGVPLLRETAPIGVIVLLRTAVQPYTDRQIELVSTFADQAVIAIENARLFNEVQARTEDLRESLQQQTATADVLKVISRSTFDLQTVLDTLTESAARLCNADVGAIVREGPDGFYHATHYNFPRGWRAASEGIPLRPGRGSAVGRVLLEARPVQIADVLADPDYAYREQQKVGGYRTILGVPLMRQDKPNGVLFLCRTRVAPFTQKHIELVSSFADQAVIAIENVRLFEDAQAKTRELSEALEHQTATSSILTVIAASPTEIDPVLKSVAESACRICQAYDAIIFLRDGERLREAAHFGSIAVDFAEWPIGRAWASGRAFVDRVPIHIHDLQTCDEDFGDAREMALRLGFRTILATPLLLEGEAIGTLTIRRTEVAPFTDKQVALLATFADQAAIAIQNVRLFDEVKARTDDLHESLQQQTATADVLKTISRSAFDLETVLQTLVESAVHLCQAEKGTITRKKGESFYRAEFFGFSPDFIDYVRSIPVESERGSATGRALLEGRTVHIVDVEADPDYYFAEAQRLGGFRTILVVPMLREHVPVGAIILTRSEVKGFTEKQIALATTFADQAAIAIENARLFEAVSERTEELARSLRDLRAAQERLVQTEKLASLGQLTAGIAHEIKNPLNFVNNFASVSKELANELREALDKIVLSQSARLNVHEYIEMLTGNLEKIVQHGKRADSIVKNMLLHSREGSGDHRSTPINPLVEESLNLAYHGARAEKPNFEVKIEKVLDPDAGEADIYPQEITRVLLNLISNAFYATARREVQSGDSDFFPRIAMSTRNLSESVEIRIRDNGTGIPEHVRSKMFNPFYTTKPAGEGTGLGLSISHDIVVKQHGGRIELSTELGSYTEFIITLPRSGPANALGKYS
jgi:two-component system NtrC family sensor kinase